MVQTAAALVQSEGRAVPDVEHIKKARKQVNAGRRAKQQVASGVDTASASGLSKLHKRYDAVVNQNAKSPGSTRDCSQLGWHRRGRVMDDTTKELIESLESIKNALPIADGPPPVTAYAGSSGLSGAAFGYPQLTFSEMQEALGDSVELSTEDLHLGWLPDTKETKGQ